MSGTTFFKAANGRDVEVDAILWGLAHQLTAGRGDGRLSKADAQQIFDSIAADSTYSDIEKKTIGHIRNNFNWTDAGDAHFRTLIRQAAGRGWTSEEIEAACN